MPIPSRACRCGRCKAREAETLARIVARSYSASELARIARVWTSANVADLETAYAAPALAAPKEG